MRSRCLRVRFHFKNLYDKMNKFLTAPHCILVLHSLVSVDASNGFGALIHNTWYVNELYAHEWNEDENTEQDPATADATARLQICDDIGHSGIFEYYGMKSVFMEDVYDELRQSKYSHLFHRIYSPSKKSESSRHPYVYTNPYTLQEFRIMRYAYGAETPFISQREYVFVCLLRRMKYFDGLSSDDSSDDDSNACFLQKGTNKHDPIRANFRGEITCANKEPTEDFLARPPDDSRDHLLKGVQENNTVGMDLGEREITTKEEKSADLEAEFHERNIAKKRPKDIIPVYVTKAYDQEMGVHVHRYIHLDPSEFVGDELMLADRSANVYSRPDFNVELHYLELRKHHKPAQTIQEDPILLYSLSEQSNERLSRICTIVATSSYFQDKFGKMRCVFNTTVLEGVVSFRTDAGKREAGKRSYRELMMACSVFISNEYAERVYISRAYNPFQVFLYLEHPLSRELYLEALATDVSAAQDRHNLGDVEI